MLISCVFCLTKRLHTQAGAPVSTLRNQAGAMPMKMILIESAPAHHSGQRAETIRGRFPSKTLGSV